MNPLPFIVASYALAILFPAGFGIAAFLRMNTATRRLAAIDPRAHRDGAGQRQGRRAG